MNHPSIIFKKNAVLTVKGYPEDMPSMEDYGLWLKMIAQGYTFGNIPKVLVYYRNRHLISKRKGLSYAKAEIILYR